MPLRSFLDIAHVEFIASVYNIHLRREQINGVEACVAKESTFSARECEALQTLSAADLVANAMASGDVDSVKGVLRKKGLDTNIAIAFQKMQIAQRNVRGSEAEKDSLMSKFFGLRVWSGCSSLFFTLNPHDIRSPISVMLLQGDVKFEKSFSLDLPDPDTEAILADALRDNPRRLHQAIVANPLAATRCFHWTVKLVLRALFNCGDSPGAAPDSVAARETPGIFGHVRAYLGIVEPQMRKALHIHMLVQLLGFSHPEDLFSEDVLPKVFRDLWYFVASISFRSTEGFAHYLHTDSGMDTLRKEPLLPLTKKQRGMIGVVRTDETVRAQLSARGLVEAPPAPQGVSRMSYISSTVHSDASVSASSWSTACIKAVAASTRTTGNHVCRPDVCHKGRIGRKGFCRMYFWHWSRAIGKNGDVGAKRSHGLTLVPRWDGVGAPPLHTGPPLHGSAALETTHPFHFKMSPSILLGPACNHDLGVLLRLWQGAGKSMDRKDAVASMLDAMGDHEYYCATYSSKDQPHIEGLLMTLSDGLRAKEQDLLRAKEAGTELTPHEMSRKILHNLVSCTNRRMHKGFQEMLTYLLRKPMMYTSHLFVSLSFGTLLKRGIARVNAIILGNDLSSGKKPRETASMPLKVKVFLSPEDYMFRHERLDQFPLYFFISACVATHQLGPGSLDWVPRWSDDIGEYVHQRSYNEEPLRSKESRGLFLCDANMVPLHDYCFYAALQTQTCWRVPLLYGQAPKTPDSNAPAKEKGIYALFMMLLFRAHHGIEDLVSRVIFGGATVRGTETDTWLFVYEVFQQWRFPFCFRFRRIEKM